MQRMYDMNDPKLKVLRKLRRCASRIKVAMSGYRLYDLPVHNDSLKVKGVIYAIFCLRSKKIYVGQTISSAELRFKQHVRASIRGDNDVFHRDMRRIGWKHFIVFPLEQLPVDERRHKQHPKQYVKQWRQISSPRELFWIEWLHTRAPLGWNTQIRRRNRHRNRVVNPLMHNRMREVSLRATALRVERNMEWFGTRDWERRCLHIVKMIKHKRVDSIRWNTYKQRTILMMIKYLESGVFIQDMPREMKNQVIEILRALVFHRVSPRVKTVEEANNFWLVWTDARLRHIDLRSILVDESISSLLPRRVGWDADDVRVVKKLMTSIGAVVLNYSKTARQQIKFMPPPRYSCMCRQFPHMYRPQNGCVLTGDLTIISDERLRRLISYGPKFRDAGHISAMNAVRECLEGFIGRYVETVTTDVEFKEWKQAVLDVCEQKIDTHAHDPPTNEPVMDEHTKSELTRLQRCFVFVPTDKASGNIALVCKRLYCDILRKELSNNTYETCVHDANDVIAAHTEFLEDRKLAVKPRLPYLYCTPKFHKDPVKFRFISGSACCTTKQLSVMLSHMLTLVLRTLRRMDDIHIVETGVRRFFVVEMAEEVPEFLGRWRRKNKIVEDENRGIYTGDFSTMYTAIPHEQLLQALRCVTMKAYAWQAQQMNLDTMQLCIEWCARTRSAKWCRALKSTHDVGRQVLTLNDLNAMIRYLVTNTYVLNGNTLHRQIVGIPMGTNSAPVMANLYLYHYESKYVDDLEQKDVDQAKEFNLSFRYIDDVMSLDNDHWMEAIARPEEEGGMYPRALILGQTNTHNMEAEFLGMNIVMNNNRFDTLVFDKRKTFPFVVNKYPMINSEMPASMIYNVLLSLLHRGYRICTNVVDFLAYSFDVACQLVSNGCLLNKIKHIFNSFVSLHVRKFVGVSKEYLFKEFATQLHTQHMH